MSHVKSMSSIAKRHIDRIMSDGKVRNVSEIMEALYNTKKRSANRHIPTRNELTKYLSKNYSKEIRRERHPLSLSITDPKRTKVPYYWKEKEKEIPFNGGELYWIKKPGGDL